MVLRTPAESADTGGDSYFIVVPEHSLCSHGRLVTQHIRCVFALNIAVHATSYIPELQQITRSLDES